MGQRDSVIESRQPSFVYRISRTQAGKAKLRSFNPETRSDHSKSRFPESRKANVARIASIATTARSELSLRHRTVVATIVAAATLFRNLSITETFRSDNHDRQRGSRAQEIRRHVSYVLISQGSYKGTWEGRLMGKAKGPEGNFVFPDKISLTDRSFEIFPRGGNVAIRLICEKTLAA